MLCALSVRVGLDSYFCRFLDAVPDVEALPAALGQCPDHFFSRASNVEADKNGD